MNETKPTGQQAPAAVQWAVNVHRTARLRQDKIQTDITAMDAKLAELAKYADEIRSNRDAAAAELANVTTDADVALEMAMAACRSHGWELPEPEGEPPLNETGQFETVQPPEPVVCKHCGRALARLPHADWHHKDSGFLACYPDGVVSTEAEPVQPDAATQIIPADDGPFALGPMTPEAEALWGHARITSTVTVHWKGGGHITGIVRAKFDDRLIVHDGEAVYDLNPADIARVEPADAAPEVSDHPATTAQDGSRTDG